MSTPVRLQAGLISPLIAEEGDNRIYALAECYFKGTFNPFGVTLSEEELPEEDFLDPLDKRNQKYKYIFIIRKDNLVGYCWSNEEIECVTG